MGSDARSDEWRHPEGNEDAPPLPAMPASVRELVDHCKADAHFPRHLIAAVEAHYAGGA